MPTTIFKNRCYLYFVHEETAEKCEGSFLKLWNGDLNPGPLVPRPIVFPLHPMAYMKLPINCPVKPLLSEGFFIVFVINLLMKIYIQHFRKCLLYFYTSPLVAHTFSRKQRKQKNGNQVLLFKIS